MHDLLFQNGVLQVWPATTVVVAAFMIGFSTGGWPGGASLAAPVLTLAIPFERAQASVLPMLVLSQFIALFIGGHNINWRELHESKHPEWHPLGSVGRPSHSPLVSFAIEAMKSPDPRVIEVLAKCLETGEPIYCMIERPEQPTYRHLMVDINRDEAGGWDVLLYQD